MSQLRKSLDKSRPREAVVMAGAMAGVAEITSTYPLDTVKTMMQVHPGRYTGMVSCGVSVIKTSGPQALYYGLGASVAQVGGKVALRFTAFDFLKGFFKDKDGSISGMGNLGAGTLAGAVEAVLWTSPTERIKVLQQNQAALGPGAPGADKYATSIGTLRTVIAEQGVKGLYLGVVPSILKQSASVGTRFWLYEVVKEHMVTDGATPAVWQTMLAGAGVGGISTVANHPFDVVKSRMQAWEGPGPCPYTGVVSGLRKIAKEDGIMATMKGLSPRFVRVAFAQAITFAVYETFLSWYCQDEGGFVPDAKQKPEDMQKTIEDLKALLAKRDARIAELEGKM